MPPACCLADLQEISEKRTLIAQNTLVTTA